MPVISITLNVGGKYVSRLITLVIILETLKLILFIHKCKNRIRCLRRGKKVGTDASDCGESRRVRSDGIRVRNVITVSNSGYLLQFTFPANVCSARPGKVRPVQVRLFGLTCTPKQPQRPSRGTSAGKVNCRKCGRDRSAKGCIAASAVIRMPDASGECLWAGFGRRDPQTSRSRRATFRH